MRHDIAGEIKHSSLRVRLFSTTQRHWLWDYITRLGQFRFPFLQSFPAGAAPSKNYMQIINKIPFDRSILPIVNILAITQDVIE